MQGNFRKSMQFANILVQFLIRKGAYLNSNRSKVPNIFVLYGALQGTVGPRIQEKNIQQTLFGYYNFIRIIFAIINTPGI